MMRYGKCGHGVAGGLRIQVRTGQDRIKAHGALIEYGICFSFLGGSVWLLFRDWAGLRFCGLILLAEVE